MNRIFLGVIFRQISSLELWVWMGKLRCGGGTSAASSWLVSWAGWGWPVLGFPPLCADDLRLPLMARPPALRVSPDRQVTASDIDCLKEAFALFDCDRDGEISVEELGKVGTTGRCFAPQLGSIFLKHLCGVEKNTDSQRRLITTKRVVSENRHCIHKESCPNGNFWEVVCWVWFRFFYHSQTPWNLELISNNESLLLSKPIRIPWNPPGIPTQCLLTRHQ